eukprot:TRINITY_DN14188_c0_g1_i1.p1 TRINITY_DN14188_c0_g1~~TRINITY_DN14188_c0_g1_i1.p1  ORF type:complete len:282 (+),score=42.67 TRINITY_DN14188_c0_g1_i1:26-847(+)
MTAQIQQDPIDKKLSQIRHKILVLSGKGGVGKSTVAAAIAEALAETGYRVGLLDIDICGPSAPHLLGVSGQTVTHSSEGWTPVYADAAQRLSVMSIGFLLPSTTEAIIWRGPKKHGMIRQFITDVSWGPLDFLVVDAPPGTSDEHITICETLKAQAGVDGAVLVTTPQEVSVLDVRKEISFCQKVRLPILGIVENMSGFICPHCTEVHELFGKGGGERLAAECQVPFLGAVPLDPRIAAAADAGECPLRSVPDSPAATALRNISKQIVARGGQ